MTDLRAVLAMALRGYYLPRSGIHGLDHWCRVLMNGIEIAALTPGADLAVVGHFAFLHDCRRLNDCTDPQHGERAAAMVGRLFRDRRLALDQNQVDLLMRACARHELGEVSRDPTIGVCWDSDRLELSRLSRRPIDHLISTDAARLPAIQSDAWERGVRRFVDADLAAELDLEGLLA